MGRKAFLFHEEWAQVLSSLPPEMRHLLTDALIDYFLTGIAPTFDNPAVAGMFRMFKNRMDADDKYYEEKCEKLRANASKRKQKEAEESKSKQMLPNASKCKQMQANVSNINLNTNLNSNLNTNLKSSNDDVMEVLNASPTKVEALQRLHKLQTSEIYEYAKQFQAHIDFVGEPHKGQADLLKHFRDWLKYRINEENKNKNDTDDNPSYKQRAEGAARLVAKCLAACDAEVRGEGQLPTPIQPF